MQHLTSDSCLAGESRECGSGRFAAGRVGTRGPSAEVLLPDAEAIEALIDAGFWASLQREEGYAPEISLAFLPPERAIRPLMFAPPLPLGRRALAPAWRRPWSRPGSASLPGLLGVNAPHHRGLAQVPQRSGIRGRAGQGPEPGRRGRGGRP